MDLKKNPFKGTRVVSRHSRFETKIQGKRRLTEVNMTFSGENFQFERVMGRKLRGQA